MSRVQRTGPVRKLHTGHFAFMRALVQGVDAQSSWERYLQTEGEASDIRRVRSAIAFMRGEFAAAAKREHKPGTARLVLIDAQRLSAGASIPTLSEFAATRGLEDFSDAEQAEAYADEYGAVARKAAPRARLIARQLAALRWLEELVAESPKAGDHVSAWLTPSLAERIERAGLPTLFALIERVNGIGLRWWTGIPGIGEAKAARIVDWFRQHEASIGARVGAHVEIRRSALLPTQLAAVVPAATALVPLEKFLVPVDLDGSHGRYRGAREQSSLGDQNDMGAIHAWLASKRAGPTVSPGAADSPTQRSYRKEAERLVLWSILKRRKPLSSLDLQDAQDYAAFLAAPPADWCGPRHRQRWTALWRPLEGPLSPTALRQALTVLRTLYTFLVSQNYVVVNPFTAVALPVPTMRPLGSSRTLTQRQWEALAALLELEEGSAAGQRRARAVRWLYATGLRISEITAARCADLHPVVRRGRDETGWFLSVVGKGGRFRQVPVPAPLVAQFRIALAATGRPMAVDAPENAEVPILANLPDGVEPWSSSGLYKAIKDLFTRCAVTMDGADGTKLRSATPHWLRHTHGSHALNGRPGHAPVPIQFVQNNLGHASVGTTSGYLQTELEDRLAVMEKFWGSE